MGYGIIRCKKIKQTALNGLKIFWDSAVRDGEVLCSCGSVCETIKEKLVILQGRQQRKIRVDAPCAIHYLVTLSKSSVEELGEIKIRDFLKESLFFLTELHGQSSIVAAFITKVGYVMHVLVTPEKDGRLNARAFTNRNALRKLQEDFYQKVSVKYGLEKGMKGAVHRTREYENLQRLKLQTAEYEQRIRELAGESLVPKDLEYPEPEMFESKKAYARRCLKCLWNYALEIIQVNRAKALEYDRMQNENRELQTKCNELLYLLSQEREESKLLRFELEEIRNLQNPKIFVH